MASPYRWIKSKAGRHITKCQRRHLRRSFSVLVLPCTSSCVPEYLWVGYALISRTTHAEPRAGPVFPSMFL